MRSASLLLVSFALVGSSCVAPPPPDVEEDSAEVRGGEGSRRGHDKVLIIRDEKGVPHLHASSVRALFYAVGYVQGQDRLWQADTLRRAATGSLAEWFGPGSLPSDVQVRLLLGPPERRAALLAAARQETRVIFESFADGMNAWIDEAAATGRLPQEYAAFGVSPRPWTVDDSLAVFFLLGSQFGWFGADELTNAAAYADLVARLGPEEGARAFADTHFLDDPSAPTTDPAGGSGHPRATPRRPGWLPRHAADAGRDLAARAREQERAFAEVGLRKGPMSNAIVVGPSISADRHALLLGGPQMGYSAPQINHEIGLHGGGFEVTGMQIAGWPLVPIGVGRDYAWTLTSGGSDNSDIFALELNPANPGQYWHRGAWRALDCSVETFAVMGAPDATQTLCRSVHGPVIAAREGVAYALANTTFGRELSSYEAWLDLGRARGFDQFRANVSRVAYNFNVFYADARGNIAHWHAGKIPVRAAGANPFFPQLGDGSSEWQDTIPFSDMPHAVNPDRGWLVNWNNKPRADWPNSSYGFWNWGPVHRVNTLYALMEERPRRSMTVDTLEEINRLAGITTDSPSGNADVVIVSTMLDEMLDAVDVSADPRLAAAVVLMREWNWLQSDEDGDGRYDNPAVAVFNAWWQAILEAQFFPVLGDAIDPTLPAQILYRLLAGDAAALPVQADYLGGQTVADALTRNLADALDELAAQFGSADMASWLPPRAEIVWEPGGIGSVPNTPWMNRGTYNQIVHLGRGRNHFAENVVAPGQSGDYRSPHFADQLELYATWTYKPMRLRLADQLRHAESIRFLRVP